MPASRQAAASDDGTSTGAALPTTSSYWWRSILIVVIAAASDLRLVASASAGELDELLDRRRRLRVAKTGRHDVHAQVLVARGVVGGRRHLVGVILDVDREVGDAVAVEIV